MYKYVFIGIPVFPIYSRKPHFNPTSLNRNISCYGLSETHCSIIARAIRYYIFIGSGVTRGGQRGHIRFYRGRFYNWKEWGGGYIALWHQKYVAAAPYFYKTWLRKLSVGRIEQLFSRYIDLSNKLFSKTKNVIRVPALKKFVFKM